MEEGRIRFKPSAGPVAVNYNESFQYDYFLKDQLGNVRVVLTDEQQTDSYPVASMEDAQLDLENIYYSNLSTRSPKPSGYPSDPTTDPNAYAAKLRGDGNKIGPGIVLKVMAGDKFTLRVNSWWKENGQDHSGSSPILNELVAALAGGIGNISGTHGGASSTELQGSGALSPGATQFLANQPYSEGKVRAYVNWILFDEQFRFVQESSGAELVHGSEEFFPHVFNNLPVTKSGYLYVYTSNQTTGIDVFFDNLQVTHIRGPLVEETHYYPFGLTMNGICSKAASSLENKRKWNKGSELQSKEFSDGSGLELYSTFYRSLDPQLGRFWQIDPKPDYSQSLYSSMNNNPISINDPLGDTARIHFRTGFLGLGKKHAVDYNNGNITNTNGTAYGGKVTGFLKKAVAGLNSLRTGANGNQLVTDIQRNPQVVNIMKGDNAFRENGDKSGLTNVVRWSPGNTSGGPDAALNQSRPAFVGLGHELAHSWDKIFDGHIDYTDWFTPTGATTPVPRADIFSTHIENLIRAEHRLNLRAFYSLSTNAAGVTIGEGEVLTPGTRQNANTITANGLNLINPNY